MPRYEYDCANCGTFADFRSLAEYQLPANCPDCGAELPRSVLCFPAISARSAKVAPGEVGKLSAGAAGHGAGCRCCGGANFKIPRSEWKKKLL